MTEVTDKIGRKFEFDRIRFKFDEELLRQAAIDVVDESRQRGQMVFDRYCELHLHKFQRNFEPSHFDNGRVLSRFSHLYTSPSPTIRITLEVSSGDLFDRYVGMPIDEIQASIRRDPAGWLRGSKMIAIEK
jgi:hypothetical protein